MYSPSGAGPACRKEEKEKKKINYYIKNTEISVNLANVLVIRQKFNYLKLNIFTLLCTYFTYVFPTVFLQFLQIFS